MKINSNLGNEGSCNSGYLVLLTGCNESCFHSQSKNHLKGVQCLSKVFKGQLFLFGAGTQEQSQEDLTVGVSKTEEARRFFLVDKRINIFVSV